MTQIDSINNQKTSQAHKFPNFLFFVLLIIVMLSFFVLGFVLGLSFNSLQTKSNSFVALTTSTKASSSVNIAAVTSDGEGSLSLGEVEIIVCSGKILLSINPFVEPDTQYSLEVASQVAQNYTKKSLSQNDVLYSVKETQAYLIGGPSAGAAFTIATIAAIQGKEVRKDVVLTGTILPDGSIGQVGGILEKAVAAADNNISIFLVPYGQGDFTYYEKISESTRKGSYTIIRNRYVPKKIDLQTYLEEQGYKIKVIEVKNISEAADIMLK
ncbi:MAG: S16 family serine protease [Candidatus Diapherotrites archaeon]